MLNNQERKNLVYLGIIAGSVAIVLLAAFISARWRIIIGFHWIGLAIATSILLWVLMNQYRKCWNRPRFWLTMLSVLTVHLAIFVPILRAYPGFKLIWWMPILMVEGPLFLIPCDFLINRPKRLHHDVRRARRVGY